MIDRSVIHAISIGLFVFTWTHFGLTNNPNVFYPLLSVCCFTLYVGNMFPVKYRDLEYRVNLVGFLFTFNNLLDEFFFNPKKFQVNEYIFILIILILVIRGRRKKHQKAVNKYL